MQTLKNAENNTSYQTVDGCDARAAYMHMHARIYGLTRSYMCTNLRMRACKYAVHARTMHAQICNDVCICMYKCVMSLHPLQIED